MKVSRSNSDPLIKGIRPKPYILISISVSNQFGINDLGPCPLSFLFLNFYFFKYGLRSRIKSRFRNNPKIDDLDQGQQFRLKHCISIPTNLTDPNLTTPT